MSILRRKAWFVRPNPHEINRIEEFLAKGIIAIGWPGIGSFDCRSKENIKQMILKQSPNLPSSELGQAAGNVQRFVNDMQIGDYVVCPDGDMIHFGVVSSGYYFDPDYDAPDVAYPHQRKVEWKNKALRRNLPDALRKKIIDWKTTGDITEVISEIEPLCKV